MTTLDNIRTRLGPSAWTLFMERLNGPLHEKAVWVYVVIVVAHLMEHIFQAYQIFVAGWARPEAKGMLGFVIPALISSEFLHFLYAVFVIAGLVLLRPAIQGAARFWWDTSIVFQAWHMFEHSLLQWQAITGDFFFGSSAPISFLQVWIPRVELHLFYNIIVTVPTLIGLYYHLYPPVKERGLKADCTCARR